MAEEKEWFKYWFDSEFYHRLYRHRDEKEAALFIDNICNFLQLPYEAKVLDLACGKGRHSVYLAQKGYNVTGIDISENSISQAKQQEKPGLQFIVHDMRLPLAGKNFDAVFNLFTSFGYFEKKEDDQKALASVFSMLVPGGIFVLDFMNTRQVIKNMRPEENSEAEGTLFHIKREVKNGFIQKHISFSDNGRHYAFTEKVRNYTRFELEEMLFATGLQIIATFGDYSLHPLDENDSQRLVLVAQKSS
ncbi:MAG: class I SAM-dependent methyltransferase [Bacteroidota bacterium]